MKRMLTLGGGLLLAMAIATGAAVAQAFPNKPITMIVPFAPGGPTDIVARVIAQRMTETLGQTVIVDNVAGAAGTIGAARVARATKDGYTLLMGPKSTMSFTPGLYPTAGFDPISDFEPVGLVASAPIMVVASKVVEATGLKDLKAAADKISGFANGNAGVGTSSHIACLLLNEKLGMKPLMTPYRGTGPALQDLAGGQVHYICDQITSLTTHIRAGTIKPIAVLAPTRSPVLPDVPTATESGVSGVDMVAWNGIFAPKGTPADVIAKLTDAIGKGIDTADAQERFRALGAEVPKADMRGPGPLAKVLAADIEKWGAVIKSNNVQVTP